MKKALRFTLIIVVAIAVAAVVLYAFRGKLFPTANTKAKDPAEYTTVKASRGDIIMTVTASGQLEPNTIITIRPDSNMPTRKLVRILVTEGQRVKANQALAEIDATGLDLDFRSAEASYESQKVKLANLKAKPADLELAQAESALTQARLNLESQQENYNSTKALADKNLASRNQLAEAERQLAIAQASYEASRLSSQNVKAQSQVDTIRAQESALTQADNDRQKAMLVLDSAVIRSPVSGVVAEVLVNAGDLVSPSTAIMTVVDPDPMILQAQVNENDMAQVRVGEMATVTPSGYPDWKITGSLTGITLHAQVVSNVSVFTTSIAVPNPEGKLLWGMNADTEIAVLELKDVLTLPTSAVRMSGGSSQVNILEGGKVLTWDVQAGASDGSRTQIVAGLDDGQEVVIVSKKTTSGAQKQGQAVRLPSPMMFR